MCCPIVPIGIRHINENGVRKMAARPPSPLAARARFPAAPAPASVTGRSQRRASGPAASGCPAGPPCPGRKAPKRAVERPVRPYNSTIERRFTLEKDAKGAQPPREGSDRSRRTTGSSPLNSDAGPSHGHRCSSCAISAATPSLPLPPGCRPSPAAAAADARLVAGRPKASSIRARATCSGDKCQNLVWQECMTIVIIWQQ